MSTTPTTEDRLALLDVMARYAAHIDERDFERYRALFSPELEAVGFGPETLRGPDAFVGFVKKALSPYDATQHMLGPQLAEIEGDHAKTRTDLQAIHRCKDPAGALFTVWGTYRTEMARVDSKWVISRHQLLVRAVQNTA